MGHWTSTSGRRRRPGPISVSSLSSSEGDDEVILTRHRDPEGSKDKPIDLESDTENDAVEPIRSGPHAGFSAAATRGGSGAVPVVEIESSTEGDVVVLVSDDDVVMDAEQNPVADQQWADRDKRLERLRDSSPPEFARNENGSRKDPEPDQGTGSFDSTLSGLCDIGTGGGGRRAALSVAQTSTEVVPGNQYHHEDDAPDAETRPAAGQSASQSDAHDRGAMSATDSAPVPAASADQSPPDGGSAASARASPGDRPPTGNSDLRSDPGRRASTSAATARPYPAKQRPAHKNARRDSNARNAAQQKGPAPPKPKRNSSAAFSRNLDQAIPIRVLPSMIPSEDFRSDFLEARAPSIRLQSSFMDTLDLFGSDDPLPYGVDAQRSERLPLNSPIDARSNFSITAPGECSAQDVACVQADADPKGQPASDNSQLTDVTGCRSEPQEREQQDDWCASASEGRQASFLEGDANSSKRDVLKSADEDANILLPRNDLSDSPPPEDGLHSFFGQSPHSPNAMGAGFESGMTNAVTEPKEAQMAESEAHFEFPVMDFDDFDVASLDGPITDTPDLDSPVPESITEQRSQPIRNLALDQEATEPDSKVYSHSAVSRECATEEKRHGPKNPVIPAREGQAVVDHVPNGAPHLSKGDVEMGRRAPLAREIQAANSYAIQAASQQQSSILLGSPQTVSECSPDLHPPSHGGFQLPEILPLVGENVRDVKVMLGAAGSPTSVHASSMRVDEAVVAHPEQSDPADLRKLDIGTESLPSNHAKSPKLSAGENSVESDRESADDDLWTWRQDLQLRAAFVSDDKDLIPFIFLRWSFHFRSLHLPRVSVCLLQCPGFPRGLCLIARYRQQVDPRSLRDLALSHIEGKSLVQAMARARRLGLT